MLDFSVLFYQILVGPLDSEENHHQTCRKQLPEEKNDPKHDVGLTADLLHFGLITMEQMDVLVCVFCHVLLIIYTGWGAPDRKRCTSRS